MISKNLIKRIKKLPLAWVYGNTLEASRTGIGVVVHISDGIYYSLYEEKSKEYKQHICIDKGTLYFWINKNKIHCSYDVYIPKKKSCLLYIIKVAEDIEILDMRGCNMY